VGAAAEQGLGLAEVAIHDIDIAADLIGRPQTIVLDVTDYASRPLRLVTSMRVYWDRIAVADLLPPA